MNQIAKISRDREFIGVHFAEGTCRDIDRVLYGGEMRTAFIREAVRREVERRISIFATDPRRALSQQGEST